MVRLHAFLRPMCLRIPDFEMGLSRQLKNITISITCKNRLTNVENSPTGCRWNTRPDVLKYAI
jgi:hypothetical protein